MGKRELTYDEVVFIQRSLVKNYLGFIENSSGEKYFDPSVMHRRIITTSIKCPICGRFVVLNEQGDSFGVSCSDGDCFKYSCRGIEEDYFVYKLSISNVKSPANSPGFSRTHNSKYIQQPINPILIRHRCHQFTPLAWGQRLMNFRAVL